MHIGESQTNLGCWEKKPRCQNFILKHQDLGEKAKRVRHW